MTIPGDPAASVPGDLVLREIAERHAFFERWFNGGAAAAELEAGLLHFDAGFRRVAPDGRESDLAELVHSLKVRRGTHATMPVAIAVEEPRIVWSRGGAVLATYVEVQTTPERTTRRRSTAFFAPAGGGEGPSLWRHVQETRINGSGRASAPAANAGDDTA